MHDEHRYLICTAVNGDSVFELWSTRPMKSDEDFEESAKAFGLAVRGPMPMGFTPMEAGTVTLGPIQICTGQYRVRRV